MTSILPPAPCATSPSLLPVHRKKTTRKAKFPPIYLQASRQNVSFACIDTAMSNPLIPYDMPIIYNKLARKTPTKPGEGAKWYLYCKTVGMYCKTVGMVDEAEVARQIADETTLNPKEAEMAISLLRKVILRNLLEGRMVARGLRPELPAGTGQGHLHLRPVARPQGRRRGEVEGTRRARLPPPHGRNGTLPAVNLFPK